MANRNRRGRLNGGVAVAILGACLSACLYVLLFASIATGEEPEAKQEPRPTPPDTAEIRALPGYRPERVRTLSFPGEAYVIEAGPGASEGTGERKGKQRPVLLIHGIAPDGAHDWDSVIPVLAKHRHVLAFDLPGFGRSSKESAKYRPMSYANFVEELIAERLPGDFDIVAHSMGVSVALEVAARHPMRVKRLVLVDAAALLNGQALSLGHIERGQDKLGAFGKLLNPVRNMSYDMMGRVSDDLVHRVALGMKGQAAQSAAAALMAHDSNPALDAIRAATLVVWGAKDETVSERGAWVLVSRIPGARIVFLEESGHTPMRDTPAEFNALVVRWLAGDAEVGRPLAPADTSATRDGVCRRHRGSMEFTGAYRKITIEHCAEVVFRGVRAQEIDLQAANVVAEDLVVEGKEVGIRLRKSRLKMSGGVIAADVPLVLEGSEVDLAGVTFRGLEIGVEGKTPSKVLCSLCRIDAGGERKLLHGFEPLRAGQTLGPDKPAAGADEPAAEGG